MASLSPFGYLLASDAGDAEAGFAREQDGKIFYGAEFLAPAEAEFLSYFDPVEEANTAEGRCGTGPVCQQEAVLDGSSFALRLRGAAGDAEAGRRAHA